MCCDEHGITKRASQELIRAVGKKIKTDESLLIYNKIKSSGGPVAV